MVLQGGQYILSIVDHYGANFPVFILGTIEIVGVAWVYGRLIYKQLNTMNFKYHISQLFLSR
jgi:solute carrier family 6 amino acid transporter-like protein 5/7/9/14